MSNRKAHTFKKTVAIIFRILLFVVMSCIIGYNLYIFNSKKLVGDALPMPFGYGCAVVLSGSM